MGLPTFASIPRRDPGGGSRQPGRGRRLPRRAYTPAIGAGRQPTGATERYRGYTARRGPLRPGYRDLIRSARPSASRARRDVASHKAPDRLAPAEAKMAAPRTGRSARSRPRQRRTRHARGIGVLLGSGPPAGRGESRSVRAVLDGHPRQYKSCPLAPRAAEATVCRTARPSAAAAPARPGRCRPSGGAWHRHRTWAGTRPLLPGPSVAVRGKPTVSPTAQPARTTSAIRPWTPRRLDAQ